MQHLDETQKLFWIHQRLPPLRHMKDIFQILLLEHCKKSPTSRISPQTSGTSKFTVAPVLSLLIQATAHAFETWREIADLSRRSVPSSVFRMMPILSRILRFLWDRAQFANQSYRSLHVFARIRAHPHEERTVLFCLFIVTVCCADPASPSPFIATRRKSILERKVHIKPTITRRSQDVSYTFSKHLQDDDLQDMYDSKSNVHKTEEKSLHNVTCRPHV